MINCNIIYHITIKVYIIKHAIIVLYLFFRNVEDETTKSRLRVVRMLFDSLCVNFKDLFSRMEMKLKAISQNNAMIANKNL